MPELVLAATTARRLQQILADPPHALLLTGPTGIGKRSIAEHLIGQFAVGPQLLSIEPEAGKQRIGIEAIRALDHFTALRIANVRPVNRIVFIANAERLTLEAQNAMLKNLEEPPAGTLLLLTSADPNQLLTTIRSRLQIMTVDRPGPVALQTALPIDDVSECQRVMALSGGLPGLAFALVYDDQQHPLVQAAADARSLLQASTFERLSQVDTLAKDKLGTHQLLYMLMQMAYATLLHGRSGEQWQRILQASYSAGADLNRGAQPKLVLTQLMLNL